MSQTQSFVSWVPAREGKQVHGQPLGTPVGRLCHPDAVTFMPFSVISFQPQPRGPAQLWVGSTWSQRSPRWEGPSLADPCSSSHPHPCIRGPCTRPASGVDFFNSQERFLVLNWEILLHFTKYSNQPLFSRDHSGWYFYHGVFPTISS